MRHKLVAGNWKMNGDRVHNAALLHAIAEQAEAMQAALLVCPPFPYLMQAAELLQGKRVQLGAQDCSAYAEGAYTGEVSAQMLADLGVEWVLLGHSERRHYHQENETLLVEKCRRVLEAGLKPLLCVGETLAEREQGLTQQVVAAQIAPFLAHFSQQELASWCIAYEPVWAIGTGLTATPEEAQAVHAAIRAQLAEVDAAWAEKVRVLYGGSVKPDNAASLLSMPDIDGGLIGGASLDAGQFLAIANAAE
ncbi:triose-phosphate isomerase [Marinospirillum sp.]|uniref:triose-phosphate isomerase n=1 Tax=Marinospirillum sp. TaxID=2183934 RepID=UPI003A8BE788